MKTSTNTTQKNSHSFVTRVLIEGAVEDELFNVVEHLKIQGSVILSGADITLQDLNNIRAVLHANGYDSYHDFGSSRLSPPAVYIAANRIPTPEDAAAAGSDDLFAYHAQNEREFFERIYVEMNRNNLSAEVGMITAAIRVDEDYRMGWVANLAQAFVAEGMEHYAAQQGAARFLEALAHVDARKDSSFQSCPDELVTAKVSPAVTTLAVENEGRCVEIYLSEKDYQAYLVIHYVNELMTMLGLPTAQPVTADSKPRVRVHPDGYVPPAENATRVERANQLLDLIFSMPRAAHSTVYASYPKFMQLAFFAHTLGAENVWFKLLDD